MPGRCRQLREEPPLPDEAPPEAFGGPRIEASEPSPFEPEPVALVERQAATEALAERILALLRTTRTADRNSDALCASLGAYFGLPGHVFGRFVDVPAKQRVISFLEDIRPALEGRR